MSALCGLCGYRCNDTCPDSIIADLRAKLALAEELATAVESQRGIWNAIDAFRAAMPKKEGGT